MLIWQASDQTDDPVKQRYLLYAECDKQQTLVLLEGAAR